MSKITSLSISLEPKKKATIHNTFLENHSGEFCTENEKSSLVSYIIFVLNIKIKTSLKTNLLITDFVLPP